MLTQTAPAVKSRFSLKDQLDLTYTARALARRAYGLARWDGDQIEQARCLREIAQMDSEIDRLGSLFDAELHASLRAGAARRTSAMAAELHRELAR
jgi:hypothetical protein